MQTLKNWALKTAFFKPLECVKIGIIERKQETMINNRKLALRVAVLLVALTVPLLYSSAKSDAQDLTNSKTTFVDNFTDPMASSKQWNQTTHGGTLLFAKGGVFLKGVGGGFPVIKTHRNPFPILGDWTASFGYRYTSVGNYGTDLACIGQNGEKIADIHQDVNAQLLQITDNVSWTKANIDWHVVSFVMTGNRIAVYLDGTLIGDRPVSIRPSSISIGGWLMADPWDWNDLQVAFVSVSAGKHVLDKNALNLNDQPADAPVSTQHTSSLPHGVAVVNVQDHDKTLFCVLGDTVHLAGTTPGQHRLSRRSFLIDGQPFTDLPADPNDNGYDFSWKPTSPGNYHLDVKFELENPFSIVSTRAMDVTVLPKAPLALEQLSRPVPASCLVTAQSVDTSIFHPSRIEFLLNGQSVGTANQSPFQVTLPFSKQSPGSYTVSYQAFDAQGARWNGETEMVTVPLRVKLTSPSAVTLASEKDQTHFTADIVPGLKIVRVDYSVDDQRVASTTAPPYDAAASLSAFKSGSHSVKAEVLVEDGATFGCDPATLTLTNLLDDARQAQLAKDEVNRQKVENARLAEQTSEAVAAKAEQDRLYAIAHPSSETLDKYTDIAYNKGLIKIFLSDDPTRVGSDYYVTLKITNLSNNPVHVIAPTLVFDDFSDEYLFPDASNASDGIYVNVDANSTREGLFKGIAPLRVANPTRKPLKIRIDAVGRKAFTILLR